MNSFQESRESGCGGLRPDDAEAAVAVGRAGIGCARISKNDGEVGFGFASDLGILFGIHLVSGVGVSRLLATGKDLKSSGIIEESGRAEPGHRAYRGQAARLLRGRSRASCRDPLMAVVRPSGDDLTSAYPIIIVAI